MITLPIPFDFYLFHLPPTLAYGNWKCPRQPSCKNTIASSLECTRKCKRPASLSRMQQVQTSTIAHLLAVAIRKSFVFAFNQMRRGRMHHTTHFDRIRTLHARIARFSMYLHAQMFAISNFAMGGNWSNEKLWITTINSSNNNKRMSLVTRSQSPLKIHYQRKPLG